MESDSRPGREDQPICHFCIRPQEDVPVLFVTEDEEPGDGLGDRPNICSECLHLLYIMLEAKGAKATAAKRRRRLSVVGRWTD